MNAPSTSPAGRAGRGEPPTWAHPALLVFVVALALRLLYLPGYATNPFFADPQMDALYHDRWALQIARGDWVGSEAFFRAPLYAYVLGVVYAVTDHSYLGARIVQAVLGALSAVLVLRIGRRLFGPVSGVLAGLMAAALATSVYYEAELLLVVLETFLGLLALDLLLDAAESGQRRRTLGRALLAGLVLGLAAITRPNFLVAAPLFGLFLLVRLRRLGRPVWFAALLLFAAGVTLPVAGVTLRNALVADDFVVIASQGGLNFYLGNNPAADGMAALAPEFRPTWYGGVRDATRLAEEALGRPLKASEVSDYWFARGLAFFRETPGQAIGLFLRKLALYWQSFEIPNNEDYYFFRRYSFLFRGPWLLTFGAVAPLAIAGLVQAAARRRFPWVLAGFVALYAVSIALFFVCGRFRAPMTPLLCVPAAWFLVEAVGRIQRREWRSLAPGAAALAVALLFVAGDHFRLGQRHTFAESHLRLGIFHAARGRPAEAEAAYRDAIAADPGFAEGHNNLGVLLMQQNRAAEALVAFERALAIDPNYPRTLNNLAAYYEREGNLDRARSFIDRALAVRPDDIEARYNAGVIYGRLGEFGASAAHFRRLLDIEPGHLAARLGLGKSLLMEERLGEAEQALNEVLAREPRHVEALHFLGLVRARSGDLEGARAAWESSLAARPDYEPARRQLELLDAIPESQERRR
jgi:tetratricopeptide (TPR) repeat protein